MYKPINLCFCSLNRCYTSSLIKVTLGKLNSATMIHKRTVNKKRGKLREPKINSPTNKKSLRVSYFLD